MFTVHESILDFMILNQNAKQSGYPQLAKAGELGWYQLFKKTPESCISKWVDVKDGIIDMPQSCENLLGVYDVDTCGERAALYADDFKNVLVRPNRKCGCTKCDIDDCMCGTTQESYFLEDVLYNGTTYQNKTFSRVLKNGNIVEEKITWVPSYDGSGNFEGVDSVTTQTTKCSLNVKSCGCISKTEENISKLRGCGCFKNDCAPYMRERYPALYNSFGYYKVSLTNKQVHIFDSNGKKTKRKQLILYYQSNGSDMLIPEYARMAFIALLDWIRKMYSPLFNVTEETQAKKRYLRQKNAMIRFLNPIPFERITQGEEYFGSNSAYKNNSMGNNNGDSNSECCENEEVCKTPDPVTITKTVTQIIQTNAPIYPIVGIVGQGGTDDPEAGQSIFQSEKLKGLGGVNSWLRVELGGTPMYSFGENKSFNYNPVSGQVDLNYNNSGNVFPAGATWFVDRNQ